MENLFKQNFLTGHALIATPNMGDPRFERSVILVCSHTADHAMGVIINKQIKDITIGQLLSQLKIDHSEKILSNPVHFGGPVQQDRGLVIHSLDYQSEKTMVIGENIGVTGSREILEDAISAGGSLPRPENFFLALGHSGWAEGQLEEEISMNVWAHVEADAALIFPDKHTDVWRKALENLGVTGAMLSPEWASNHNNSERLH